MAKQTVNLGVIPNGVGGDDVRTGFTKVNENFTELYTTPSQAEAEAGTSQVVKGWTAQRIRQGITAWYTGISGAIGRTILGRGTAAQVRGDLGLGTAATRDVGTASGNVMEVGAFGLGGRSSYATNYDIETAEVGFSKFANTNDPALPSIGTSLIFGGRSGDGIGPNNLLAQLISDVSAAPLTLQVRRSENGNPWRELVTLYHTGNTTIDPDGTLKASSPVINLYTNKHDLHNESQFGATPTVSRKSKGVYEITGTLGLRSEGWYLDTPSDRNGNKYFNIKWTQNITPEAVDGIVDEYRDDIVVSIETFERVWNKETGVFENGAPIDINDLQDRFVQLRFNEIKVEHEEVIDDLP